ncbi:MAG: hypothetical protein IJW23_09825 [Lentisphaeria bacterium]|nr:hypothetical protein [Lentisphaeria bacterium]
MKKRSAERCGSTGLFAKISLFLLVMSTILLPVHGEITKKILFVDDNYYSQYAGDTATAERYFLAQGFTPMTAPEILDFMKNGKAPGSVILSLTDVNPKIWVEPYDKTCAVYQYCSRGGRFVNPAGSTFLSFIGKDDLFGKKYDAHYPKKSFFYQTFGVNFAYGLRGKDRVLTDTGKAWGLNRDWPRWGNYLDIAVYADSVTPFVVAKKGTAALIWLKNINKDYPNSGLIGASFNLRDFLPMLEAIYKVCLYDGKPILSVPKVNYKKRSAVKDYVLKAEYNGVPRSVFERGETISVKVATQKKSPFKVVAVDSDGTVLPDLNTELWKEGEYTLRCLVNGKTVAEKKIFVAAKRKVQEYPIFIWKSARRHFKREGVAAAFIANHHLNTVIDDIHEMTGSNLDRLGNVVDNTLKYHQYFTARTSILRMFTDNKNDQLVLYTGKVHSHGVNHLSMSSRAAAADFKVYADRQSRQIKQLLGLKAPNFYKYTTVNDDGSMLGNFDFHPATMTDFEVKTGIKRSQLPKFVKQKHGYHVYLPVVKPGIIPWNHPFLQYFRYHTSNYNKIAKETASASHGVLVGDIGLMAGPLYPGRGFYPPLSHTNYPTVTFYNYTFWYAAISYNIEFAKTAGRDKPWGAVVSAHYTPWGEVFQRGIIYRLIANAPQFIGLWHLDQGTDFNLPEIQNTWKGTQEITANLAKAGAFYKLQKPVRRKAALLYDIAQICFQIDHKNAYPYSRYTALENFRRAGGSADVISSEEVVAGALKNYDLIILHDCQWMTDKVRDLLIDYIKKGGKVIGDKSVKIDIPGMEKSPNLFGAGLGHIGAGYCTMNFTKPIKKYLPQEAVSSMGINGVVYNNEMPDKTPLAWVIDCETNKEARECQTAMSRNWNGGAYKYLTATAAKTGLREHKLKIRDNVFVYDLFNHREVPVINGIATVKLRLLDAVPLLLLKDRIVKLNATVKNAAVSRGKQVTVELSLMGAGNKLIPGMVPAQIKVMKNGKELWAYGGNVILKDGKVIYTITVPQNESAGVWEISALELASGKTAKTTVTIK